jgi:hypothetical protein
VLQERAASPALERSPFFYYGWREESNFRSLRSVIFRVGSGFPILITNCWMDGGQFEESEELAADAGRGYTHLSSQVGMGFRRSPWELWKDRWETSPERSLEKPMERSAS